MKATCSVVLSVLVLLAAPSLFASGPMGICAIIEQVVFEPDERAPERVQVFGAFAFYAGDVNRPLGFTDPARGYMYFRLAPGDDAELPRREWADLAAVAGTGEAVAFGRYGYSGDFGQLQPDSRTSSASILEPRGPNRPMFASPNVSVRPASEAPAAPAVYASGGFGVVRLGTGNHDRIVAELRSLLER